MAKECAMITYLRELAQRDGIDNRGTAIAADVALRIIADVRENHLTDMDAESIHMLVDDIYKSGHEILLAELQRDMADCDICAALVSRMQPNN